MTLILSQFSPVQIATAKAIYQAFASQLGSFAGVAAAVNAFAESSLRPNVVGDEGKSFGLWQDQLREQILAHTGIDLATANVQEQCTAILWDLRNTNKAALAKILAATTYEDATMEFCRYFERPGAADQADKRAADVPVFLEMLGLA